MTAEMNCCVGDVVMRPVYTCRNAAWASLAVAGARSSPLTAGLGATTAGWYAAPMAALKTFSNSDCVAPSLANSPMTAASFASASFASVSAASFGSTMLAANVRRRMRWNGGFGWMPETHTASMQMQSTRQGSILS